MMLLYNCRDIGEGKTDEYGKGCEYYDEHPEECGFYDTIEFTANTMCNSCILPSTEGNCGNYKAN